MQQLEYSSDAFLSRSLFYNLPIVYVEGQDDVAFWANLLTTLDIHCEIQDLGSVEEAKKRLPAIMAENSGKNFIAIDCDYRKYQGNIPESNVVFITPGYGIENAMFCMHKLKQFIFNLTCLKSPDHYENFLRNLTVKFKEYFFELVTLDILNRLTSKSKRILKRPFKDFYCKSSFFDVEKINQITMECRNYFTSEELDQINDFKEQLSENFMNDTRCHFIEAFFAEAIRHFPTRTGKKPSVSNDALRAHFSSCTCQQRCETIENLLDQISTKFNSFAH